MCAQHTLTALLRMPTGKVLKIEVGGISDVARDSWTWKESPRYGGSY